MLSGDELSLDSEVRFKVRLDGRDYPIHGLPVGDTIAIDMGDGDAVTSVIKAGGATEMVEREGLEPSTPAL